MMQIICLLQIIKYPACLYPFILPIKCNNGNLRLRLISTISTTPSLVSVFSSRESSSAMR